MADNVDYQSTLASPASGTKVATDEVATKHYQLVKLVDGTADSEGRIGGDATNGLDVDVTRVTGVVHVDDNAGSLTVDGTVTANAGTGPFPVSDNAGSLTVDAPVATPVAARLSDGAAFVPTVNNADSDIARVGLVTDARNRVWNGASWDRLPGGTDGVTVRDGGGSLTVDGPLTDAQLRAAVVPVGDGGGSLTVDGTFWQATQPVSGTVTADSELEAAAALADASSNPTTARVGAGNLVWNGTGWDRARGDITNGIDVDVTRVQGNVAVTGTFWQATQPVSVAAAVDTSDRAAREVGRVRIWDGTDEATVVPLRTQPATSEKAIPIFDIPNRLATYAVTTAEIAPAITIGVKELLAVWAAAAGSKDKYIVEIWLTALVTTTSTTGGRTTARVSTITSAPTGGTELGKVDLGGAGAADMTNTMSVKTGGGTLGTTFIRREMWHALQVAGSRVSEFLFQASNPGNGIILRAGSAAGISIDCERAVAHTALADQWTVGVRWIEV